MLVFTPGNLILLGAAIVQATNGNIITAQAWFDAFVKFVTAGS